MHCNLTRLGNGKYIHLPSRRHIEVSIFIIFVRHSLTFSPLALLMALSGLSTRRTRSIFTTLMALDLEENSSSQNSGFTVPVGIIFELNTSHGYKVSSSYITNDEMHCLPAQTYTTL